MAWEERNGRMYYYRKRREGKRVISEYVGGDLWGGLAEIFDMEDKQEAEQKRAELREQKEAALRLDKRIKEIEKYTKVMTWVGLLLAGYHTHKRQWRKLRND